MQPVSETISPANDFFRLSTLDLLLLLIAIAFLIPLGIYVPDVAGSESNISQANLSRDYSNITKFAIVTNNSNNSSGKETQGKEDTSHLNSTTVATLISKADVLEDQERYNEALQYYDKALAMDPTNTDELYNKALALDNLKR
jgi:tetratricopeptide (TPR) repeat protein